MVHICRLGTTMAPGQRAAVQVSQQAPWKASSGGRHARTPSVSALGHGPAGQGTHPHGLTGVRSASPYTFQSPAGRSPWGQCLWKCLGLWPSPLSVRVGGGQGGTGSWPWEVGPLTHAGRAPARRLAPKYAQLALVNTLTLLLSPTHTRLDRNSVRLAGIRLSGSSLWGADGLGFDCHPFNM